jgi:hypothetical protein
VPAARREPAEQRIPGGLFVEVKRLRVELGREPLDLVRVDPVPIAAEALADVKVVEIEPLGLGLGHAVLLRRVCRARNGLAAV